MELFEEKFENDMPMEAAILLGLEGLSKSSEEELNEEAVEIGIMRKGETFKRLTDEEVGRYIEKIPKAS
jgi:proteasome alpha subunit